MTTEHAPGATSGFDHELFLAEVYDEVERRRSSGELPPDLEAELDRAFAELAPAGAVGDDSALLLERVERAAFIEPRVPLEHLRPPVSLIKRVLFKLMAWYVHFVTEQVTAFGGAVTGVLRNHDSRLRTIETAGPPVPPELRAELDRLGDVPPPAPLVEAAVGALAAPVGRVAVAEVGDGSVLRALRAAGVDAYGVEPRRARLADVLRDGLEVRTATAVAHLRDVGEGRLGGVVLNAVVERGAPAVQVELATRAARAVAPGGAVLVLSRSPEAWAASLDDPTVDLAPGRPLRPATWRHLLGRAGLVVDDVHLAPADPALEPLPEGTPGAEQLNAVLERISAHVAPAPAYLVVARRPS